MMIEMPPRELRRGNAARNGVEKSEDAVETVVGCGEDGTVHDFVQQHCAIEDCEPGDERKWQPEIPTIEVNDGHAGQHERCKIAERYQRVQPRPLGVQTAQILGGKLCRELMFELLCVICPVGHDRSSATGGSYRLFG